MKGSTFSCCVKLNVKMHYHYMLKKLKYPDVYVVSRPNSKLNVSVWNSQFSNNLERRFIIVISIQE